MEKENKKRKNPKNLLESGEYNILGPENGDISINKIVLQSHTGAKRIWKVKFLDQKQIVLEVEKFG